MDHYSAKEREEIGWWTKTLEQWEVYRTRPGVNATEMDKRFVAYMQLEQPDRNISIPTLYRKRKALQENDLDGLTDNRGKGRRNKSSLHPEVLRTFCDFYLRDNQLSVPDCIRLTESWALQACPEALPLPGESTFYRAAQQIPLATRKYARGGARTWYNEASPYITRRYDDFNSNDIWVGDTYTCDIMTMGANDKPHRMYLSAWLDVRSSVFVGWYLGESSGSQNTIYALRRGITEHGLPNHNLYTDNGREFLTYDFGGRGHRAKKVLADGSAPWEPPTIMNRMDVEMVNAIVKNSRAKTVERYFLEMKNHIMKLFPTYTGGKPDERPESLKGTLKRGKLHTDAEAIKILDQLIGGYLNYMEYGGSVETDKGKRRIDVYREHLVQERRPASEDVLQLMLMRTSRPLRVRREGLELPIHGAKILYFSDELYNQCFNQQVYVRYDPDDISTVRVYDMDDRFLLEVQQSELVASYGTDSASIAEKVRTQRRVEKAVRADIENRVRGGERLDPIAYALDISARNLAGGSARKGTNTVKLVYDEEAPLLAAVGDLDIARMNRNAMRRNGGSHDHEDF